MTQESPTVTPPPPRPSPYYASSTRHDDNDNGEQQHQHQQRRKYDESDYEEIYYHFDDYAQEIILANASKFLTPPEPAEHYEWEEAIIDEASQSEWEGMKKSFCFGMGCGLLGFGLLRWRRDRGGLFTRGGRMNNMNMNSTRTTSTGGYKFDPLPPKPQNSAMHHHHQHHYNNNNNNNNSRSGAIIDMVLSTFLGIGTSLLAIESDIFYPKTNTITSNDNNNNNIIISPPPQWISPQIPLVPGRSLTADTLCQPLTEEFRKFPKQLWQSGSNQNMGIENGYHNHMALYANSGWKGTKYYKGNDNASIVSLGESNDIGASGTSYDDDHDATNNHPPEEGTYYYERLVLDNLQGFIINCERRSRHEERLRKMKGMRNNKTTTTNYNGTKKTPVVIPGGGVSAEEDLELDDIYYHLIDDGNDDN